MKNMGKQQFYLQDADTIQKETQNSLGRNQIFLVS